MPHVAAQPGEQEALQGGGSGAKKDRNARKPAAGRAKAPDAGPTKLGRPKHKHEGLEQSDEEDSPRGKEDEFDQGTEDASWKRHFTRMSIALVLVIVVILGVAKRLSAGDPSGSDPAKNSGNFNLGDKVMVVGLGRGEILEFVSEGRQQKAKVQLAGSGHVQVLSMVAVSQLRHVVGYQLTTVDASCAEGFNLEDPQVCAKAADELSMAFKRSAVSDLPKGCVIDTYDPKVVHFNLYGGPRPRARVQWVCQPGGAPVLPAADAKPLDSQRLDPPLPPGPPAAAAGPKPTSVAYAAGAGDDESLRPGAVAHVEKVKLPQEAPQPWPSSPQHTGEPLLPPLTVPTPPPGVVNFVIVTEPRSGSRFMVDMLQSNPEITTFGEVFWDAVGDTAFELSKVYKHQDKKSRIVGFKAVSTKQWEVNGLPQALADARARVIFLWRSNLLRHMVSKIANDDYRYKGLVPTHAKSTQAVEMGGSVKIQMPVGQKLYKVLGRLERQKAWAEKLFSGLPALHVAYEDIIATAPNCAEWWRRIQEFVGARPTVLQTRFYAVHAFKPVQDSISNWDDVRASLEANGKYRHYLELSLNEKPGALNPSCGVPKGG